MSDGKFCIKCGCAVPAGAQYCQQCGSPIAGSDAEKQRDDMYKEYDNAVKDARMTWLTFLLVIYAVPAIIWAAWALMDMTAITNTIWNNTEFQSWLASHSTVTIDTVRTYVTAIAYMILASGVLTAVSLVCVVKRKWWMVAVITCFIAAFLCIGSIFGMLIGILVGWMIYSAKDSFTDVPKDADKETQ